MWRAPSSSATAPSSTLRQFGILAATVAVVFTTSRGCSYPLRIQRHPNSCKFIDTTRRPGSLPYSIPKAEISRQQQLVTRPQRHPPFFSMPYPWETVSRKSEFTKEEDLGIHDMEGLPVHEVR